jgi:hypothetical protein
MIFEQNLSESELHWILFVLKLYRGNLSGTRDASKTFQDISLRSNMIVPSDIRLPICSESYDIRLS